MTRLVTVHRWMVGNSEVSLIYRGSSESFFGAGGFHLDPRIFGKHGKIVEFAGAAEPLAAVNDDTLAVDVFRQVADQKCRKIRELFVAAEALHGVFVAGIVFI